MASLVKVNTATTPSRGAKGCRMHHYIVSTLLLQTIPTCSDRSSGLTQLLGARAVAKKKSPEMISMGSNQRSTCISSDDLYYNSSFSPEMRQKVVQNQAKASRWKTHTLLVCTEVCTYHR